MERLEIPRDAFLTDKNYTVWKMIVSSVLEQYDLGYIVEGKELDEEKATPEILKKARSARTFLLFSMNREHRNKVAHCTKAEEIWKGIANIYENKSKRAVNMLWKRLFNYRIDSLSQISKGISEMQTIVSALRARGITVDESCLVGCIECALPTEFNDWLINWSMCDSEPSLNELTNSINNHAETLKTVEAKACVARAQRTNQNKLSSSQSKTSQDKSIKSNKFCNYCKKTGHDITECRKLKAKKEQEKTSKEKSNQDSSVIESFGMMASTTQLASSVWLADSGCSLHMTSHLEWISDYRRLELPTIIRLGDDRTIEALGFGIIKTSVGIIHNVHYVPAIGSNLFSIQSATSRGIEVNINQNSMTFHKDGHLITQAKRRNTVNIMQFEIYPPTEATCATATLEEWHKRFGHISNNTIKRIQQSQADDDRFEHQSEPI